MRTLLRATVAVAAVLGAAAVLARRAGERSPAGPPTSRPIRVLPPDTVIAGPVLAEHRVGAYLLQIIHDTVENDRIADIRRGGRRVYAVRAMDVRMDPVGVDITGDRVPDLVIHQFSGGLHCCSRATIFSLGPEFAQLGSIDGGDGDIELEDVNRDGIPEFKVGDWRFAYWRQYAFVETQAPAVLFAYRNGGYEVACDLMRSDPPEPAERRARARDLTDGWTSGDPPADFWGYAVDLVYQGHADVAFRWLETSWPPAVPGKAEFTRALRLKLRGSPCWSPPPDQPVT